VGKRVAWISIFKGAVCLVGGGALMGLFRGSAGSGALAGVFLFALLLAIALAVIAFDYWARRPERPAAPKLKERGREAA